MDSFHRKLGSVMIDRCGIGRHADGLRQGLEQVKALEERFEAEVRVPGEASAQCRAGESATGQVLRAGPADAAGCPGPGGVVRCSLPRRTPKDDGEARRDDVNFAHIAWEHNTNGEPIRHSEPLQFTALQPSTRSYK